MKFRVEDGVLEGLGAVAEAEHCRYVSLLAVHGD